jgi:phosphatidylglycerophosphate synthase
MTISEVKEKSMTPEKIESDKMSPLVYYVGRQVSFVITAPIVSLGISANRVTQFSLVPILASFLFIGFSHSVRLRIFGILLWGLWAILDYVDGNLARIYNSSSEYGGLWDAFVGYVAMSVWPLSTSMSALQDFMHSQFYLPLEPSIYVLLGGITSICMLLPRLVMHKRFRSFSNDNKFQNRKYYGYAQRCALMLTDPVQLPIYFYFFAVLFHLINIYTIFFAIVSLIMCIISLVQIFYGFWKSDIRLKGEQGL